MIDNTLLHTLNDIVANSGEKMEGNLFYLHESIPLDQSLYSFYDGKRQRLQNLARRFGYITEIGFNAGHSAALMLTANPGLKLCSIDIGVHSYVLPCAATIQTYFPGQHTMVIKDSRHMERNELARAGAVIIDGGHSFENCFLDLAQCIAYCRSNTVIVIDDFDALTVRAAYDRLSSSFKLWPEMVGDNTQGIFCLV
jgi:hypothetical protein